MRLSNFINEKISIYGPGITFMDIDETILKTYARVKVVKDGKVIARLRNHEYLQYVPKEGETTDFSEYSSAEEFYKTAEPIPKVVDRIKRIFKNIHRRGSRVVIVTGRQDFDDKVKFLDTFRKFDIPIDNIYVERVGNTPEATNDLPQAKKKVIWKYLKTGKYRRARLIDDSSRNCKAFLELAHEIPEDLEKQMRERYNIPEDEPVIDFYGLKVTEKGSLLRITI
jgi:hypothetical protein